VAGLTRLDELIAGLSPGLEPDSYVLISIPGAVYGDLAELEPLASIREHEGLSLVIERSRARAAQVGDEPVFRMISLNVHSSLEAVGLTAAVASALAGQGISANMLAGYFHDHILVPAADAERALDVLKSLS
jgi:hypothetical protein